MGRPQGENKARLEAFEKDYEIEIKEATSHAFADPTKTDSNGGEEPIPCYILTLKYDVE